jgi:ATP-dependent exoDNAse (exonuclease V) beta subunit
MSLADSHARHEIATRLDVTMVVEAAAGTGKTTELVRRIVAVLASGAARIDEIVAVTFTEKAAGELKLRLRTELESARRAAPAPPARMAIELALAHLEDGRVGTIHAFCSDLLRERPVEARVDPGFTVLTEAQAERLYGEAFSLWLQERLEAPPEGVRRSLRRQSHGIDDESPAERLRKAGWTLASWRDMPAPWRRPTFDRMAAVDRLVDDVRRFAGMTAACTTPKDALFKAAAPARQLDQEIQASEQVRPRDHDGLEAALVALAQQRTFTNPRYTGYDPNWRGSGTRTDVLSAHAALVAGLEAFREDADADLAALLQQELLETVERYEHLKARAGALDFLDLLLKARDLVRGCDDVRVDFQRRFRRLFVDEFQDTDPLQAEILLLLASDDPQVRDWRQVTPAPAKLFIVGDPKQSIYRFRRADVGVYREVVTALVARGATALNLTTSFRGVPAIQEVVNAAFAPLMNGDADCLQASYVPLAPDRRDPADRPAVVVLPVPRPHGARGRVAQGAIEASLADAIGAFVSWLVRESGWKVTERDRDGPVDVAARHVCILLRRFEKYAVGDMTRPYVQALEARGVPHLLVGGRSFHAREEVATIRAALAAVEWPDDELSVFATLRGSLFAVGDEALLEYRDRYGHLHPFRTPGGDLPERLAPIVEALSLLRSLHRERNHRPVAETLATLLRATRAHAGFILRPSGEQALANVLHVAELARAYEASGGLSFRGFVTELEDDAEDGQAADAPILEEASDGVRLMTVHKAKGLEFPVVILADMTARLTRSDPDRSIDRERGLSAVRIAGWTPADLIDRRDEEHARDEAEAVRVAYVAATRARDLLVIPALGERMYEDGWLSPLNRAVYPVDDRRRHAEPAPGCPAFGPDTVLADPDDPAPRGSVRPGLHVLRGGYSVVWWDPAVLALDVRASFGIRQTDLIAKEIDAAIVALDLQRFERWRDERRLLLEQASRPSLSVRTATEYAAAAASTGREPVNGVEIIEIARSAARPSGPRFGALVHAVLSCTPLDPVGRSTEEVAEQQARVLGATPDETRATVEIVRAVLEHPLLERARRADARARCRRETPVSLVEAGTLIEGVVDLAFEDEDAWTVLDFKTDQEIGGREDEYRRQIHLYARAIAQATGRPAHGILLRI